ncbi:MAG: Fe-S cluster assembly ATPase SufC [Chlamydiales bacterium]|jgi:Fe-S cluster assembly ATP-binding protein|nr:Fe-S cluster assembly ATPase SufC [Chlamydiales bacterium]
MLEIKQLQAAVAGKAILKGLNLQVNPGEIHAIMGPNGAGKSTLAKILAGDPSYEITAGNLIFEGKSLLELSAYERAHLGIFLGFQYPVEITGISNFQFLHVAYNAKRKAQFLEPLSEETFNEIIQEKMQLVEVKSEFKSRNINEGFSGGEKKKNEILQMAVLEPKLAILDETDSGLDIDAMKVVAKGVQSVLKPDSSLLLITHYQRLLDYIKPHFVHVILDGTIVKSGTVALALELERKGYDWLN